MTYLKYGKIDFRPASHFRMTVMKLCSAFATQTIMCTHLLHIYTEQNRQKV